MKSVNVSLDTVDKVKGFVNTVAPLDGEFDLSSDRYVVDAKSIMGIFSLDLSKPLVLTFQDVATADRVIPKLAAYIIPE